MLCKLVNFRLESKWKCIYHSHVFKSFLSHLVSAHQRAHAQTIWSLATNQNWQMITCDCRSTELQAPLFFLSSTHLTDCWRIPWQIVAFEEKERRGWRSGFRHELTILTNTVNRSHWPLNPGEENSKRISGKRFSGRLRWFSLFWVDKWLITDWKYCQKVENRPTSETWHPHLFGRGHHQGLHDGKVLGVDEIYAEVMRPLISGSCGWCLYQMTVSFFFANSDVELEAQGAYSDKIR